MSSSRWWLPFDGMEELSFKHAPDGWIYRAPNPWLFGHARYYLLGDKQKSDIAGHHRRMWRFPLLAILALAATGVPVSLAGFDDEHALATLGITILVGLVVGFVANLWLYRTVRPVIAGLRPTAQRITQADVLKAQVAVFSHGYMLFFGLLSLALFALIALQPLLTSAGWDVRSLCGALLFGSATIYWFALYIAKRRQSPVRSR
jgi:hypothetical protein